ncbi:hypothetical protein KFZ70_05030 [Tamlana fucoidanivorans]|uniref:Uncharacterized protein n=1 Tax=Allotamlana fucoidanivorans TaxID=2583814 RepID=A0A5C4SRS8_9FLAO|nr:hypothetical protein [Tamlana fucoidanivorans]TNJ47120.1 hypothetical protein FGF67_00945 [Tamlana fucoidanivorans]
MNKSLKAINYKSELISVKEYDFSEDFVAISCEVDDSGVCRHSGLIISYDGAIFYFHFGGKSVELENLNDQTDDLNSLYIKKLDIISNEEVVVFLGHCEKLQKIGVHPKYGFLFDDSYYDSSDYKSFLVNANYDITTCVGFCVKVIRMFIHNNDEYLKLDDWNISSIYDADQWVKDFMNKYLPIYAKAYGLSIADLFAQNEIKRIAPSELLSSTFFTDLPIRKLSIDGIRPELEEFFLKIKRRAA